MAKVMPVSADQIVMMPIGSIIPYDKNPRKNKDAVDAVAASIKEYGFKSPILITEGNVVINGHTRLKAAKKLGLDQVPCVVAHGLTEKQIRQYRLIDNKTSEYAAWDKDLLAGELEDLDLNLDYDFDFSEDIKHWAPWGTTKKLCDLKERPALRTQNGIWLHGLFKCGKTGKSLEEIKTPEYVQYFAETAARFVQESLGPNLRTGGWCVVTTPRRRHKEGFHFATEVCRGISETIGAPFYEDVLTCANRARLDPLMEQVRFPQEKNVILYDDIWTTGTTLRISREMLIDSGYTVFPVISIINRL